MFARIEPQVFTEWIAASELILEPERWLQMAVVCETVQNEISAELRPELCRYQVVCETVQNENAITRAQKAGKKVTDNMLATANNYLPEAMRNGKNR